MTIILNKISLLDFKAANNIFLLYFSLYLLSLFDLWPNVFFVKINLINLSGESTFIGIISSFIFF